MMKEQAFEKMKQQLLEKKGRDFEKMTQRLLEIKGGDVEVPVEIKGGDVEVPEATLSSQEALGVDDLQAWIALRAYELYEQEGCCDGYDVYHWLKAEREILESVHGEILSTDASAPIEPAHGEDQIAAVKGSISKREAWIRNSKGSPTL